MDLIVFSTKPEMKLGQWVMGSPGEVFWPGQLVSRCHYSEWNASYSQMNVSAAFGELY